MQPADARYPADWHAWRDPPLPDRFNATEWLLDRHVGGRTALVVDGRRYSYAELHEHVCRAAGALAGLGLEPEQRLVLFGTDSLEWIATWLGAIRCGVVPVGISDLYPAERLLYFLDDTAARGLFIDAEQLRLQDAAPGGVRACAPADHADEDRPQVPARRMTAPRIRG